MSSGAVMTLSAEEQGQTFRRWSCERVTPTVLLFIAEVKCYIPGKPVVLRCIYNDPKINLCDE